MHVPRTCLRIGLLLITLVLISILLGIGVLLGPVARLIVVEAWLVVSWSY